MTKKIFLKGSSLSAYARKKAVKLGLNPTKMKLTDMVWMVQEKEGHVSCFKREEECVYNTCCWQLSCGATMR